MILIMEMLSWNTMALLLLEVVVYIAISFLVSFYYCIFVLSLFFFIVYEQFNKLDIDDPGMPTQRNKFNVHKFATNYDLGSPVAGNFFQAERN